MSDIMVSRKRHRRAIDPCLGFYVSTAQACHDEEIFSGSRSDFALANVSSSLLGERRNTVEQMLKYTDLVVESPLDLTMHWAVAGENTVEPPIGNDFISSSQYAIDIPLEDHPVTPELRRRPHHDLDILRPTLNGEMPPMTVERFLRLSAAATTNDRAFKMSRFVSKRKHRYRVSENPAPRSKSSTGRDICGTKTNVFVEEGLTSLTTPPGALHTDEDSIQLRSRKIRRTMPKSPGLAQKSEKEGMDSDSDTSKQGSTDEGFGDKKQPPKRKRRAATTKKLNERLFEALVLTHGHPDETLINPDPNDPDSSPRGALHFVPQASAVQDGRKRKARTFVNPRTSLAIRSAMLYIPTRHDGSGTQMGSVLNRWPVNVVQQNKAMEDRQTHQLDQGQAHRAHPSLQNRSTTSSFDSQTNDRHPLTFTNAVCAERSYTRMFSSAVYVTSQPNCGSPFNSIRRSRVGPSKPKPEKILPSRGVIDLTSIKNGAVSLKRLSSEQDSNCQEVINAAESIDEPATLRIRLSSADSLNIREDIQEISELVDSNKQQPISLNPALDNTTLSILSEILSPGTRPQNDHSSQTAKNTLQREARGDNLNLYGGEAAEVIDTSLNKPPIPLAPFMEYCQQGIPGVSVAENQDIDSHSQPQCKELAITRHRLTHFRGVRARRAGPFIELSPISGFSKASIEGYEETNIDEIKNEYPRMRSILRFEDS